MRKHHNTMPMPPRSVYGISLWAFRFPGGEIMACCGQLDDRLVVGSQQRAKHHAVAHGSQNMRSCTALYCTLSTDHAQEEAPWQRAVGMHCQEHVRSISPIIRADGTLATWMPNRPILRPMPIAQRARRCTSSSTQATQSYLQEEGAHLHQAGPQRHARQRVGALPHGRDRTIRGLQ